LQPPGLDGGIGFRPFLGLSSGIALEYEDASQHGVVEKRSCDRQLVFRMELAHVGQMRLLQLFGGLGGHLRSIRRPLQQNEEELRRLRLRLLLGHTYSSERQNQKDESSATDCLHKVSWTPILINS